MIQVIRGLPVPPTLNDYPPEVHDAAWRLLEKLKKLKTSRVHWLYNVCGEVLRDWTQSREHFEQCRKGANRMISQTKQKDKAAGAWLAILLLAYRAIVDQESYRIVLHTGFGDESILITGSNEVEAEQK